MDKLGKIKERRTAHAGWRGHADGDIRSATVNRPFGICVLKNMQRTLAFTDTHNNAVRFIYHKHNKASSRQHSPQDGSGIYVETIVNAGLLAPKGICCSQDGRYLFVCDSGHHKIKFAALPANSALVDTEQIVNGIEMFTFAGNGRKAWKDGPVLESSFNSPSGVCECANGTILIADTGNHCIRHITRSGPAGKLIVRTVAGGYMSCRATTIGEEQEMQGMGKRIAGYRDGRKALFHSPSALTVGSYGEVLVADTMNNCIRGLLPSLEADKVRWEVRTVCGERARRGHVNGSTEIAEFNQPMAICFGEDGTFFVADRGNCCIRQVGGCIAQFSGRLTDCLSYSWVRTVEVDQVDRCLRSNILLGACGELGYPLGITILHECEPLSVWNADGTAHNMLVVCDGGNNSIHQYSLDGIDHANNIDEVCSPSTTTNTHSKTDQWRDGRCSSSSESDATEQCDDFQAGESRPCSIENDEGSIESNTATRDYIDNNNRSCICDCSHALEEALAANAALQLENQRLKELLYRTFDEIEFASRQHGLD